MKEFKDGQKVRRIKDKESWKQPPVGVIGTLHQIGDIPIVFAFVSDYDFCGNTCCGKCKDGHGCWISQTDAPHFEEVKEETKVNKFKECDRVRVVADNIGFQKGSIVTIIKTDDSNVPYCAKDEKGNRHWLHESDVTSIGSTIVIRSDNKVTTAYLKDGHKTVESAKATCSPADTFDIYTGADIALKRLFDKPVEEVKTAAEPKFKFDIDQKVKVVHEGAEYTDYKEFVEKYAPQLCTNFYVGAPLNDEKVCRVIRRAEHPEFKGRLLYIIMNMESLQVCVIEERGLESVE